MLGEHSKKKKLETIQLSNNTVKSPVQDLSADIEKYFVSRLKTSFVFSLELHKSTDVSELAVLLVCACYLFQNKIVEDTQSKCAVLKFLPFPPYYLRSLFSMYAVIKSKYHYRMNVAPDVRVHLSIIAPNFESLFTLVAYEVRLRVYSNSISLLLGNFCASGIGRL